MGAGNTDQDSCLPSTGRHGEERGDDDAGEQTDGPCGGTRGTRKDAGDGSRGMPRGWGTAR